jgi:hypothetical protein
MAGGRTATAGQDWRCGLKWNGRSEGLMGRGKRNRDLTDVLINQSKKRSAAQAVRTKSERARCCTAVGNRRETARAPAHGDERGDCSRRKRPTAPKQTRKSSALEAREQESRWLRATCSCAGVSDRSSKQKLTVRQDLKLIRPKSTSAAAGMSKSTRGS